MWARQLGEGGVLFGLLEVKGLHSYFRYEYKNSGQLFDQISRSQTDSLSKDLF